MNNIFAPMPPMESLESRVARQVARECARNPALRVPRPGHSAFVGPLRPFNTRDFYDPRPNMPGRNYWGD